MHLISLIKRFIGWALSKTGIVIRISKESRAYACPETLSKNKQLLDRFREIVSDPINLLIERVPAAGYVNASGEVTLHNGNLVPAFGRLAYYSKFSEILIINRGVHEPLEEWVFQETLKHMSGMKPTMIEVGAYWGHYSMWLKRANPDSTVILIEPERRFLRVAKRNFKRNNLDAVFVQAFVGSKPRSSRRVAIETIEGILAKFSLAQVDILHADIQGAELPMLQDSLDSLRRGQVRRLFISTHSQALHVSVRELLRNSNFQIEIDSDWETETTSEDGLIVASHESEPKLRMATSMGRLAILSSNSKEKLGYLSRMLS